MGRPNRPGCDYLRTLPDCHLDHSGRVWRHRGTIRPHCFSIKRLLTSYCVDARLLFCQSTDSDSESYCSIRQLCIFDTLTDHFVCYHTHDQWQLSFLDNRETKFCQLAGSRQVRAWMVGLDRLLRTYINWYQPDHHALNFQGLRSTVLLGLAR